MRQFTDADIETGGSLPGIYADRSDMLYDPPEWMKSGLQETATGYGSRLNSGYKISFNGKLYRVYVTCYSNAGTCWFCRKHNGKTQRIIVR